VGRRRNGAQSRGAMTGDAPDHRPEPAPLPEAHVQTRRSFHVIWLIPIVAAVIAAYLGYRAISERGPTIEISFATADGLTEGQTKIRHKAVDLGTVTRIRLAKDMSHVIVTADMHAEAERILTDNTQFWVVRPRFEPGNITGLETLVSGAYLEMDPGQPGGRPRTKFDGLAQPPAVRSDEPGRNFVLQTGQLGSLGSGAPVFYRDIVVGEVLGYRLPPVDQLPTAGVRVDIFVRKPFDELIHTNTRFWNASGVSVKLGADGVRLELQSLRALFSGGVAFETPLAPRGGPVSEAGAVFPLYADKAAADTAGFQGKVPLLVYFKGSVRGLAVGAPVELYGIQVGTVTGIHLEFDPTGQNTRVAVHLEIQPERIFGIGKVPDTPPLEITRALVAHGMQAELSSANLITGQLLVAISFQPGPAAGTTQVTEQDGAFVIPGTAGGLENITAGLGSLVNKLNALPLADIGRNLDESLSSIHDLTTSSDLKEGLKALHDALLSLRQLINAANEGVDPAMRRLPEIAQGLQTAMDRANRLLASTDTGYGGNSQFRRDLERLLDQFSDTARSVRLLADFLDQHPEALLRGRTGAAAAP
jgi:paraquat-inducible protein B